MILWSHHQIVYLCFRMPVKPTALFAHAPIPTLLSIELMQATADNHKCQLFQLYWSVFQGVHQ